MLCIFATLRTLEQRQVELLETAARLEQSLRDRKDAPLRHSQEEETEAAEASAESKEKQGYRLDVKLWTAEAVKDWVFTTLRGSMISGQRSLEAANAFIEVNGEDLVDLVRDRSHGLSLENKLVFLGLDNDIVQLLAPKISNLAAFSPVT